MQDYAFIEHGYRSSLVEREAAGIITLPEGKSDNPDPEERASSIVRERHATDKISPMLREHVMSVTEPYSIYYLMSGTINLINTILERSRQGRPIDTLLFLDKSARNGGYLFRLVWQELQNRGELPDGVNRPEIRFMNIGREDDRKHQHRAPLELLKEKYRDIDFRNQRVAVVDEIVDTGESLRRGLKTIEDAYGTTPVGLAQFLKIPSWYGNKQMGLLGVTDLEDNGQRYDEIKKDLDRILPEEARRLSEIVSKTSKNEFTSIISKIMSHSTKSPGIIHKLLVSGGYSVLQEKDVESLLDVIKELELGFEDGVYVWQYIDSAGGFASRRLHGEQQNNSIYYRQILRDIVSSYMLERDNEKKSERQANSTG